jgi:hypothetical protein
MRPPLAPSTINAIFGELGDPDEFEEGFQKKGIISGQIIQQMSGAEFHKPHIIEYTAKIIKKDESLEWELVDWRVAV